jgi:hypothetical protein
MSNFDINIKQNGHGSKIKIITHLYASDKAEVMLTTKTEVKMKLFSSESKINKGIPKKAIGHWIEGWLRIIILFFLLWVKQKYSVVINKYIDFLSFSLLTKREKGSDSEQKEKSNANSSQKGIPKPTAKIIKMKNVRETEIDLESNIVDIQIGNDNCKCSVLVFMHAIKQVQIS